MIECSLKELLRAFVRIEVAQFEMEDRVAHYTEAEMPRLNDAGVYGTDRHFANPVPVDLQKAVLPSAQGTSTKLADHGMDAVRPILVKHQRPQVRMPVDSIPYWSWSSRSYQAAAGVIGVAEGMGPLHRRAEHAVFAAVRDR